MTYAILFKALGGLGVLLIAAGISIKTSKKQYILHVMGGLLIGAYSVYAKDFVFIALQAIFTVVAAYNLFKK